MIGRSIRASLAVVLCAHAVCGAELHVAPGGSDANPGTAEKPLATLEQARGAARRARGATVVLAPGTYRLARTLELDARDSGTTWRAAPGAEVRVSGGVAVPAGAAQPVTDAAVLARLPPEARGKALAIDLRALGIADPGAVGPRGFRRPYVPAPLELFVDDAPLTLARWPNPGAPGVPIGKVLDAGSITRNGEKPERGGVFAFDTPRPDRWAGAGDVWITGLFRYGYADDTVRVNAIDLAKRTLATAQPHMYGFGSGKPWNRWVALNLLEEIDLPGEFAVDRAAGTLYFVPPAGKDMARARLEVSALADPLVAIEGATNVVFDGLTFECARGMGVYIERGAGNRIANGTLRNLGMVAVCIGKGVAPDPLYRHGFTGQPVSRALGSWHEHIYDNTAFDREAGRGHAVVGCAIYNIGAGAVSLGGGDRRTLAPGGNAVERCDIRDFNRWDRTYKGAVNIDGVGNRVAHCRIHEAPALALYLHGNDHVIEYNEVFNAMLDGDDMGCFYMGRDPSERGNVIRYNDWHDIGVSPRAHMTFCLYFDDAGGDGSRVYGNRFCRTGKRSVVMVNGGSDFTIANNIFIDCPPAVEMGSMGVWRTKEGLFEKRLAAIGYNRPPWTARYPEFADYLAARGQMPRRNVFERNLLVNTKLPPAKGIAMRANRSVAADSGRGDTGIPGFEPIPWDRIGLKPGP